MPLIFQSQREETNKDSSKNSYSLHLCVSRDHYGHSQPLYCESLSVYSFGFWLPVQPTWLIHSRHSTATIPFLSSLFLAVVNYNCALIENKFLLSLQTVPPFTAPSYCANSVTRIWNFGWHVKTTKTPSRKRWPPKRRRFTTTSSPSKHPKKCVLFGLLFYFDMKIRLFADFSCCNVYPYSNQFKDIYGCRSQQY